MKSPQTKVLLPLASAALIFTAILPGTALAHGYDHHWTPRISINWGHWVEPRHHHHHGHFHHRHKRHVHNHGHYRKRHSSGPRHGHGHGHGHPGHHHGHQHNKILRKTLH